MIESKAVGLLLALALLAGCAGTSSRPIEALAAAQASVELAEQNDAQEHSTAELTRARQKLQTARQLADEGEHERARRLAREASVDARVAAAKAEKEKNVEAAAEVQESLRTLEQELARADRDR